MGHKKSKKHSTQTPRQTQPEPEPVPELNNDDQPADYAAVPVNDAEADPSAAASKPVIVACLPAKKHPSEKNEDEAEILKGLLEFKAQKWENSDSDSIKMDDKLFEFLKNKLHVEVTKPQVIAKLKRLKKRFINAKMKKNLTYDEKKFFELCKKIWGVEDYDNGGDKIKANDVDNGGVGEEEVVEMMRAKAMKMMGKKGRGELREMWRKVEVAQMQVDSLRWKARIFENRKIMEALGLVNSMTSENLNGDLQLE